MVDFNTKKNILQKLRKKRSENKLLWLPCIIAAAFVKLWYGTVCGIGMALSDRNGNFLGIKMHERKPKSRRQDDIVYVKKPFIGRVMSAVLAAAFVLMFAPELNFVDLGIRAGAVGTNTIVAWDEEGNESFTFVLENGATTAVDGATIYLQSEAEHVEQCLVATITDIKTANGTMRLSWKYSAKDSCNHRNMQHALFNEYNNPTSQVIDHYTLLIGLTERTIGFNDVKATADGYYTEISGLPSDANSYDLTIVPVAKIQPWKFIAGKTPDPDDPDPDPTLAKDRVTLGGTRKSIADVTGMEYIYAAAGAASKGIGRFDATLESPTLEVGTVENGVFTGLNPGSEYFYDTNVYLRWTVSKQQGGLDDGEATGYRVHVGTDSFNGNVMWQTPITYISSENGFVNTAADGDQYHTVAVPVQPGLHYQFYVEAYKVNWSGSGSSTVYDSSNIGMITSGSNPQGNSKTRDLYTAPVTPGISAKQNVSSSGDSYYEITVEHSGDNNNYDGIYLFRTEGVELTDKNVDFDTTRYPTFGDWLADNATRDGNPAYHNLKVMQSAFTNGRTTYSDEDITEGKTYYYYAVAHRDIQKNGAIHVICATKYSYTNTTFTLDRFKKTVPTIRRVTSADGQVTIEWESVNGAERYELQAKQTGIHDEETNKTNDYSGGDWETIYDGKDTSYEHKDLYNSDRYEYRVRAVVDMKTVGENSDVEDYITTQWSKIARATVGTLLDTPMNVRATSIDGQTTVTWDAVAGATGYDLHYISDDPTDSSGVIGGLRNLTYTHTNINNGRVYTYWVVAYKEISIGGDPQNPQKVTSQESNRIRVKVGQELKTPQNIQLSTIDGQITVTWDAVQGAEGYLLYYKRNDGSFSENPFDLSSPSFTHTGLLNGDTYTYYVKAYKEVSGERVYSPESIRVSKMVGAVLDAPKDFTVTTADGTVNMTWSAVQGAEGYIIHASSGGRYYQFDVSRVNYTHSDLNNGDVWTYYVTAYKTVNGSRTYSNPSESKTVTIGISLNSAVDLTATAGNRQIDLTWTAVNGADGYVVYLYNSSTMEFEPITVTSRTNYSHVGLKNGKQYTYMVAPYKNINGKRFYGDYSMSVTAIPTTGSITDMDHELIVKGTAPYGISHSEYITAVSNHGAFDESVDVYFSTNRESTQAVRDVLRNYADGLSSFIIYPFDISIYRENTYIEVDPADGYTVTVTMPVPDRLIAYRDYITVVHIGDGVEESEEISLAEDWFDNYDQRLEVLPCAIVDIDNVWCVQFKCSSFSPYALVIYKEHIQDVASGGGLMDTGFADTFNSGVLLFTALPDILPNNRKLKIVQSGSKRYHIKSVTKK